MKIVEGITGYWYYHLSLDSEPYIALCGAKVLTTEMPLKNWKVPFGKHFPKRPTWCKECDQLKEVENELIK